MSGILIFTALVFMLFALPYILIRDYRRTLAGIRASAERSTILSQLTEEQPR